jgi:hypothetical protein
MKNKISGVLAFVLGIMSVIAGSRVLFEFNSPDYDVLKWLVVYNVMMGIVSIMVSRPIWRRSNLSFRAAAIVTGFHATILLTLVTVYYTTVASESIKAMIFRVSIWAIISLMLVKNTKSKKNFI